LVAAFAPANMVTKPWQNADDVIASATDVNISFFICFVWI